MTSPPGSRGGRVGAIGCTPGPPGPVRVRGLLESPAAPAASRVAPGLRAQLPGRGHGRGLGTAAAAAVAGHAAAAVAGAVVVVVVVAAAAGPAGECAGAVVSPARSPPVYLSR